MINLGLCGFGTVGSGVYKIISENTHFKDKVKVSKILVHNIDKHENILDYATTNYLDIVNDSSIDTVIECIGGTTLAYDIIKTSLINKKNVITANKAVLIDHLKELTNLAKENNVALYFEASVCGAIPVIDTLESINLSDEVLSVEGIINGSTNFILTKAFDGLKYNESLELARELGFLESDPTDDLCGYDALRKLVILSNISYHTNLDYKDSYLYGINNLSDEIIEYAKSKGYIIKYVAESKKYNDKVSLVIEPVLLNKSDVLASVNNELNSVCLKTKYSRSLTLTGYGAGSLPTASAIVLDLNKVIMGKKYYFDFSNNYECCGKVDSAKYLIHTKEALDTNLVEESEANIYLTKSVEYTRIKEVLESSICYVKVKEEC